MKKLLEKIRKVILIQWNQGLKEFTMRCQFFFQNLILTGFSALLDRERYGGEYQSFKRLLEKSQWYSPDELKSYQESKLRDIVSYS